MNNEDYEDYMNKGTGYIYMIKPYAYYKNGVKRLPFKIGYSRHEDVTPRLKSIQAGNFIPLHVHATYGRMVDIRSRERTIHNYILRNFSKARTDDSVGKEWFWLSLKELKETEKLILDIADFYAT